MYAPIMVNMVDRQAKTLVSERISGFKKLSVFRGLKFPGWAHVFQ